MSISHFIVFLLVGGIAGWLAGLISKGRGFGILGNILVGIIGAFLGDFLFGVLGIVALGVIGRILFALVGALIFLWVLGRVRK